MERAMFGHSQHAHLLGRRRWFAFSFVCVAILILFSITIPVFALPTGYQEYYVLGYEEHVWRAFRAIYDGPDSHIPGRICSTVSLVATADYQVIYYDHWEDGYERDLLNPIQSSTLIFGDGDTGNGGVGSDVLFAGDDINLTSDQDLTGPAAVNGYVAVDPVRNPADIRYDGGDRVITSGGPVDLTHAMWPLNNSWIGGAWEVYSRQAYADTYSYRLPVGEDLYGFGGGGGGTYGDFRNVYLQLTAFEDDTAVSIDNGAGVVHLTLDRGQTYSSMGYINSTSVRPVTIHAGSTIRTNKPVQVGLLTGADQSVWYQFQGRSLIVLPDQMWGSDYVVPVPSGNPGHEAEIYLSNPNDFPITVHAYDREAQTSFVISPTAYISATVPYSQKRGGYVPADSAARFNSAEGSFGVVVCADTSKVEYAWGFSAIPSKYLTQDYYISWAPGSDNTPPTENGSPVWVAPVSDDTIFYVDFSPVDGTVDETFTLDLLQQRRIFDPDNDNTGMHVWATGEFAVAWGEDPRTAGVADPYLDMGFTTLPLLQRWLDPVLTLEKEAEPTVLPRTGGTVTFTLRPQAHNAPLANVDITDTLPMNWTYVPGSTRLTYPGGGTESPEPAIDGQVLFWDLSAHLDPNQSLTLDFQAQITDTDGVKLSINQGEAVGIYEGTGVRFNPSDEAAVHFGSLNLAKSVSSPEAGIGDTLVYTLSYANLSDPFAVTEVVLRDPLPAQDVTFVSASAGGTYSPASGTVTWELGTLVPGASGHATFIVTVNDFVEDGTVIKNMAYIDSAEGVAGGSNVVRTTVLAPEVEFTKLGPAIVARGQAITYTLSYENAGGAQATGVVIRDTIPVSTTYVGGSLAIDTGSGWDTLTDATDGDQGAYISPTLVITPGGVPGTIGAGETGRVRFSVRPGGSLSLGSRIQNWARLSREPGISLESNLAVTRISSLTINKAAEQVEVAPGDVISYTLTYANVSTTTAQTEIYVRDPIPDYTSLISGTVYGGDQVEYSSDNGDTWSPTVPVTPVTHVRWYDAGLPPSTHVAGGFAVRVNDILLPDTIIRNGAYISSTETAEHLREWIRSNEVEVATTATHRTAITGTVFEDADGDGVRDAGELGISGVLITLDGIVTTTTDLSGNYNFPITTTGVHVVVETDPSAYGLAVFRKGHVEAGVVPHGIERVSVFADLLDPPSYFSTTPNEVYVNVTLGRVYRVDFGDMLINSGFAAVYGTVFDDDDGDGVRDVGDLGIAGVLVMLDGIVTTTTNLNGTYTFPITTPGIHIVVETDPDGYFSTTPNSGHIDVILGTGYRLDFGDALTGSDFATIYGTVFEDTSGDGKRSAGELGIAYVLITLDGIVTTTTDLYGNYSFPIGVPGTHEVIETDPEDHISTTQNEVDIEVALGAEYPVDFGDMPPEVFNCDADFYEDDDTADRASVFVVGTSQAHQFCDDAIDWVKFSAKANTIYTFTTFSWGQRADTFLTLFGTDGRTMLAANDDHPGATDYSSRIVWMAPTDGVYYVRITNRAGLVGYRTDYDLLIESEYASSIIYLPIVMRNSGGGGIVPARSSTVLHPTGIITHTCRDVYEIDDTWKQITEKNAIEPGVMQVHSFDSDTTMYAADKDFVWFDLPGSQAVKFAAAPPTNTQTLMELYDECGSALGVTGTNRLVWISASSGRYYLSVSPQAGLTSFGCADEVGYNLMMETGDVHTIYLPVVRRDG